MGTLKAVTSSIFIKFVMLLIRRLTAGVRVARLDQPLIIRSICPANMIFSVFSGIFDLK